MPEPKRGESREGFISRCIAHLISKEGKEKKEAAGQCYGMWDNKKKE